MNPKTKQKNQHEWTFEGNDKELGGDWCYCHLCHTWRVNQEKRTYAEYIRRLQEGKITGI